MSDAGTARYEAVLFDLDGTLVDTAPDMVHVLTTMQGRRGRPVSDYDVARNNVSNGSLGLLRMGFPEADDEMLNGMIGEFLSDYRNHLCVDSTIFSPLDELLQEISSKDIQWGVVTNKPTAMTIPLMEALQIQQSAGCIVCGDTLPERKPHPAPMLYAASLINVEPSRVIYVGDASRDIDAGKAAGMMTVSVGYGYITPGDDPESWGADFYAADTLTLVNLLRESLSPSPDE
jgi:2-phosphoglycolate phosphatase